MVMTRGEKLEQLLGVLDETRRWRGQLLDAFGFGPERTLSAVHDIATGVQLRSYPSISADGPVVLLVSAPIKRSYIWDLAPEVSVVARCRAHGFRVHLVEWTDPGRLQQQYGLDQYADRLLVGCIEAVIQRTGVPRICVVGHSLGGTLAAVCAARYPDLIAALALLEAPLHFAADAGALAPLIAWASPAMVARVAADAVSGSLLDLVAAVAAPEEFQLDRYLDFLRSIGDRAAVMTHLRVLRWTDDEFTLAQRLFVEIVERLYRRDEFMRGSLEIAGQHVGPPTLRVPVLNVRQRAARMHQASPPLLSSQDATVPAAALHQWDDPPRL
jgi:polyhydroxyalkanoate synthase